MAMSFGRGGHLVSRSRDLVSVLCVLAAVSPAAATVLPTGFVETLVTDGLHSATASVHSPDGRIFVAEQDGTIRVVKDGALLATTFAKLDADDLGERGLLGIGLDPGFPTTPLVYVYYSALAVGANRLSRLVASGDVALPGEEVLVEFPRSEERRVGK